MANAEQTTRIIDTNSEIPEFWERDVLFFANLMSLFFGNNTELEELGRLVGEIDSYGGRLVPVLNTIYRSQDNVLVLEREPDASLCQYFQSRLGLDLPKIEVLSHEQYLASAGSAPNWAQDRITDSPYWVDGYVTDDVLATWARRLDLPTVSSTAGSHRGNNKRLLHEFLESSGLPAPNSRLANDSNDVHARLRELETAGFRKAAVRSALGASGIGTLKVDIHGGGAFPPIPGFFFHEGACLVQGWIEPGINGVGRVESPSAQLFLDDNSVHLFDITDQILSHDSVHEGNTSPPPYLDEGLRNELHRQAGMVGGWLHEQGYRGTASIDFIVAFPTQGGPPIVYTSEINARVTGATYPSVLARRFVPGGAWLMQNLRLHKPWSGESLLQKLDDRSELYGSGDSEGVLPINFNFDPSNRISKVQMLFLGSDVDRCLSLVRGLENDDELHFQAERD